MRKITYQILLALMFFNVNLICNAQSVNDLEKQVNKLQSEIKTSQNLLKKTSKNKETTIREVELLQAQIKKRDDLIKAYEKQIALLNKETKGYRNDINKLQNELEKNRKEYADLLVIHYRNRNNLNNLLFIFSSEDFNQAVRRMRYIQQFNELLKHKMEEIDATKADIKVRIDQNEATKKEIESLNNTQKKERESLNKDKKSIKKEIAQKEKETKNLQAKIKKIIEEELARRKADATIDMNLAANFESNKGKLPWPVASGVVTKKYGKSTHPTQSKVTVMNNGIDISTDQGANALCVFDGQVSTVFNTGSTNVVMVRHGTFFTLYANLDKVYVKSGDKVKTGDKLGLIHTGATDNVTTLHFEVWNDKNNTNPELWLK